MTNPDSSNIELSQVTIEGDLYYKLSNSNALRPFFMNVVSDGNHWMFISSNGGLSIGRRNADNALFPYYTEDKITESAEVTGSKTIIRIENRVWEPFSVRSEGRFQITRNLYKSIYGNRIRFEEINHDLELTFRYTWSSSDRFGFVRQSELLNHGKHPVEVSLLDGIQNILPSGVPSDLQNRVSNLVDAYKRCELIPESGLGLFSLSAIIVDKAEPSEALKANAAWSLGLPNAKHLLSSRQLDGFRQGIPVVEETDVKGEKGGYFIQEELQLSSGERKDWFLIANVNLDHADVAALSQRIVKGSDLEDVILHDIRAGTERLVGIVAASDGLQLTSDRQRDSRHFSNTLFNVMRGGIFDMNYRIGKADLADHVRNANKLVFKKFEQEIDALPDSFQLSALKEFANRSRDAAFRRLCNEYLPLKFSRRHGDPSRPWNRFSINMRNPDGTKLLDYEGNWRDIFQNWEALAYAYPDFAESMVCKFLNAMTFDGYNPYRVTRDGFDWETIEADDPWSYIGYWGDHQVIYLLKLLEIIEQHQPGKLAGYYDRDDFVYANVPYRIKSYGAILENPKDTIEFDHESDSRIRRQREAMGADAALMLDEDQSIYTVNFIEKVLALVLAKLSNFIPEGGIWMNTQRPEWNDANNALVGNGVSMVTLCYLRRFLQFFRNTLDSAESDRFEVSNELIVCYKRMRESLENHRDLLSGKFSDASRKGLLDELGQAASDYREHIYKRTFWGEKRTVSLDGLKRFADVAIKYMEHTIRANKREDGLYHAYNLMTVEGDGIAISRLDEMLEGQVAVLSSGFLTAGQSLEVLDALKNSALFRDDQYSYLLYPDKDLPGFIEKNNIPESAVVSSPLLRKLTEDGDNRIVKKDVNGICHFNGDFRNAGDLAQALDTLSGTKYADLAQQDRRLVLQIFEEVFHHKAFTGRSGTFFGYEGLGSIYWHMVSKLRLAAEECCIRAIEDDHHPQVVGRLLEHYYEIREGIGVHKSPSLYGAFPTDPYSHTPSGKGAQQPGMTGQVKEDILCRFGELGVFVEQGKIAFNPCLLLKEEFLRAPKQFEYVDVNGRRKAVELEAGMLGFTYCQVPVVYQLSVKDGLEVHFNDGRMDAAESRNLDESTSHMVFHRKGLVERIHVYIEESVLK